MLLFQNRDNSHSKASLPASAHVYTITINGAARLYFSAPEEFAEVKFAYLKKLRPRSVALAHIFDHGQYCRYWEDTAWNCS